MGGAPKEGEKGRTLGHGRLARLDDRLGCEGHWAEDAHARAVRVQEPVPRAGPER